MFAKTKFMKVWKFLFFLINCEYIFDFIFIYLLHNLIQYIILLEMKNLSEDLKWRVVFCIAEGYTQKETAERLYISIGTVNKVYNIYKY